jgi:hypothetical protein
MSVDMVGRSITAAVMAIGKRQRREELGGRPRTGRVKALGDSPDDLRKGVLLVAEPKIGVGRCSGSLLRVDRYVGDLGRLKDAFQELPARLIARLLEKSSALEPDMPLAGEADRDVHGWHNTRLCFGSRRWVG